MDLHDGRDLTDLHDISAVPTHRLGRPGALLAAPSAIVLRQPGGDSPAVAAARRGRLRGAEAYEGDADQLRQQANRIEQQLWDLSAQLKHTRARHDELRAAISASSASAGDLEALGHERASVNQQMARLEGELARARAAYVAVLSEAHTHLEAARVLRHEASG